MIYAAEYLKFERQLLKRFSAVSSTYPTMVGSIAIFPPIAVNTTPKVRNTTDIGTHLSRGSRPRLNLSSKADNGNSVMTMSHTKENLWRPSQFRRHEYEYVMTC